MKLLLCGGGSREQTELANKVFKEIIDHNKPLLYIPLAMDENKYSYDDCLKWITKELEEVDIPSIDMVRNFEELKNKNFNDYCAIFIGGGNTYKLLKGLKDNHIFEKLREYINNDGIVYGGSAGAIIFGYDINSILVMDPNNVGLKDTKGFDVLEGKSIFAHYTNEHNDEEHLKFKKYLEEYSTDNEPVIALPEEDTIYVNGDKVSIIGTRDYYEFNKGLEEIKELDNNIYVLRK